MVSNYQILVIHQKGSVKTAQSNTVAQTAVFHEVMAKEQSILLLKKYGITIEELEKNLEVVAVYLLLQIINKECSKSFT
jgi:hypothetical protein